MLVFGTGGLLGLLPLACGLVPGFELLQPLALVLSAGLLFSLAGSLFLLPVFIRDAAGDTRPGHAAGIFPPRE